MKNLYKLCNIIVIATIMLQEASAQVQLTPVLVSSGGNFSTWAGGSLSSSVGEPVISTFSSSSNFLTQGFQQPRLTQELTIEVTIKNTTCTGSADGNAVAVLVGGVPPYIYEWTPNVGTTDSVFNLAEGDYSVTITDFYNRKATTSFSIIADFVGNCKFKFYSGITPNADGNNDSWIIDGVEFYPDNTVSIFNRWGDKVWEGAGYDNINVVWTGTNASGQNLTDGTYFYVATFNGEDYHKGWVELTR